MYYWTSLPEHKLIWYSSLMNVHLHDNKQRNKKWDATCIFLFLHSVPPSITTKNPYQDFSFLYEWIINSFFPYNISYFFIMMRNAPSKKCVYLHMRTSKNNSVGGDVEYSFCNIIKGVHTCYMILLWNNLLSR